MCGGGGTPEDGAQLWRTGEKLVSGVWLSPNDEQRTLDTGFRKCHCSLLERLTLAPLAPSPRVPLAACSGEQTPGGAAGRAMLQGKDGCCV